MRKKGASKGDPLWPQGAQIQVTSSLVELTQQNLIFVVIVFIAALNCIIKSRGKVLKEITVSKFKYREQLFFRTRFEMGFNPVNRACYSDRLRFSEGDKISYRLKHPYKNGTTHLSFTCSEFFKKLIALVPPQGTSYSYSTSKQ